MLIEDRGSTATTSVESTLAEVLADVLRVDNLSVDSHFFDELRADSLVMAKFCARVRKRGDLPSISMQDIYRYSTIRSLAAGSRTRRPGLPRHRRSRLRRPAARESTSAAERCRPCSSLSIPMHPWSLSRRATTGSRRARVLSESIYG